MRQGRATEVKHAPTRNEKTRENEQGKDRQQKKKTYFLETRKQVKVSKTKRGNRGKHTPTRDEKACRSE